MDRLFKEYKDIWEVKNGSHDLKAIKKVLKPYLRKYDYTFDNIGNIYIGNFAKVRPCLVAHIDSVFKEKPKNLKCKDGIITSSSGIGGDDKCGIIAILELLGKNDNINAVLTVNEEVGGIGASNIDAKKLENTMYFIEIDRQGNKDFISSIYNQSICHTDFLVDVSKYRKAYGFEYADGMYTDILDICQLTNISAINLSAGYYCPHTKEEFIILKDLQKTIAFVNDIVKNVRKKYALPFMLEYEEFSNDEFKYALQDIQDLDTLIDLASFYGDYDIEKVIRKAYLLGKKDSYKNLGFGISNNTQREIFNYRK